MNEKLIKTLKEERNILYPGKLMVIPRGFGKTYMMLNRMLRYAAYEHVCSIYKQLDYEVTLEQAHKDMDEFVASVMSELQEDSMVEKAISLYKSDFTEEQQEIICDEFDADTNGEFIACVIDLNSVSQGIQNNSFM